MARRPEEVQYGSPIEATVEALVKLLGQKPLLWGGSDHGEARRSDRALRMRLYEQNWSAR